MYLRYKFKCNLIQGSPVTRLGGEWIAEISLDSQQQQQQQQQTDAKLLGPTNVTFVDVSIFLLKNKFNFYINISKNKKKA